MIAETPAVPAMIIRCRRRYTVTGMTYSHCVNSVGSEIKQIPA